jgi:isoleucyl-tRNA synthetase
MDEQSIQENIMKFWTQNDIQKQTIAQNKSYPKVTIYDGPPFPTGPPHHGHMMTSTVKDTVTRYLMATGHYVPRQLGWDMYGPNNPSTNVMNSHIASWEHALTLLGRWVDNDGKGATYRTSDLEYAESVWWVFKTLWNKGHLRMGYGLTPHCPNCNLFYSDFERHQQQCVVTEQTVYYKVPVRCSCHRQCLCPSQLLVWEMWPWTIVDLTCYAMGPPGSGYVIDSDGTLMSKNYAMGSGSDSDYRTVSSIPEFEALNPLTGAYVPVVSSSLVDPLKGTGITRIAPNLDIRSRTILSLDSPPDGHLPELRSSQDIIDCLRNGRFLVSVKEITHNDSACPKCSERLITYPYHGIFYNICDNRSSIEKTLQKIYWEPKSSKQRILQYLSVAQDWLITRNAESGQGIDVPMWVCADKPPLIIGCYADLETKAVQGRRQIGYRFDNWFDSACMPYASVGYPFKTTKMELTHSLFPCLLAIEGVDQVYGWFFTSNVISNALFDAPAFLNIITNGLVLDTHSGQKMSKSKCQTEPSPDPIDEITTHGADIYRVYLMKNRLLSGVDFKYDRSKINNHFTRALYTVYNQIIRYGGGTVNIKFRPTRITNITDNWILQALDDYLARYHQLMSVFKVARALSLATQFLNSIKKYIYFNRSRLSGLETISRSVIVRVFYHYLLTISPFIPFNSEHLYRQLQNYDWIPNNPLSIHHCQIPKQQWRMNKQFLRSSDLMFQVIDLINKTPVSSKRIRVYLNDITLIRGVDGYISEVTGKDIIYCNNLGSVLIGQVKIHHHKAFDQEDVKKLQTMTLEQIIQLDNDGHYRKRDGDCTYPGQYVISYRPKPGTGAGTDCYGTGVLVKVADMELLVPSPSQSLVDSKDVIIKGQIIGRRLDRQIKKSGRCIVYIEHPMLAEITDERAKVLVSNINRYTLPIINQSIYQYRESETRTGFPFCTIIMTVFSCPITFHLSPIDEECTET